MMLGIGNNLVSGLAGYPVSGLAGGRVNRQTGEPVNWLTNQANRRTKAGFTLVEVLLAVTVLAIGLVGVLRAYTVSINALGVCRETINAVSLLKGKMVKIEQIVLEGGDVSASSGEFSGVGEEGYRWELELKPSGTDGLNEAILVVFHEEKPRKFSLATYFNNAANH